MRYLTRIALLFCILLAFPIDASAREDVSRWTSRIFAKGQQPPFSFCLDGVPSSEFIRSWKWASEQMACSDTACTAMRYSWSGRGLQVICEVKLCPSAGEAEWVLRFKNLSNSNSGQISQINTADLQLAFAKKGDIVLHYAEGNKISRADYAPRSLTLPQGQSCCFCPAGGRSSEEAFPFYNIESPSSRSGAIMAIGWSGTWFSSFAKTGRKSLDVKAGLPSADLYLKPGEEIRTPSVAFIFWEGTRMNGHNALRRYILEHHSRIGSRRDYLCSGFNYRDPQPFGEYSAITAQWAVAMIERYRQFGLNPDIYWMDAGWHHGASDFLHGRSWANTTGNWRVDARRFPDGMKPISDAAHAAGAQFLLWFEPERVVRGTEWALEHPEWMLEYPLHPAGSEESSWLLFDLGNDQACNWLCKYYGDMIEAGGIDCYRQDCNIKPAVYWAYNDEPGRAGMREIRHIENLYRFWDYLLERFPGILIDNCASGGKRLDWESIARTVPLWRSDYYHYDDPDGYQCHTYGLNFWLPVHGTGILLPDEYSFRSSLSSTLIYNWKITEPGVSIEQMQHNIAVYRDIRDYYFEDYYPLSGTGDLTGHDVWLAYQMHRPSDGSGIVVAFRRKDAPQGEYTVKLGGIDVSRNYTLEFESASQTCRVSGKTLSEGYVLHLEQPGTSLLIKYCLE